MKKVLKIICQFLYFLVHPTAYKFYKINKKLERATLKEMKKREGLKRKIDAYVYRHYGVNISKFIPPKGIDKQQIHYVVCHVFQSEMNDCKLKLSTDLKWKV